MRGDWLHKRGIIKEVDILKIMKAKFLSEKKLTNKGRKLQKAFMLK